MQGDQRSETFRTQRASRTERRRQGTPSATYGRPPSVRHAPHTLVAYDVSPLPPASKERRKAGEKKKKEKLSINCDVLYLPRQQQLPVKTQVCGAVVRQAVLLEPGLRREQYSERKHTILIMTQRQTRGLGGSVVSTLPEPSSRF